MNKKWETYNLDKNLVNQIVEKFNISKLVANIIVHKNILTDDEIEVFLHPRRTDFHDPFLMPDMTKAVERIIKAISEKEKITIYGDYDVDGITSSTILKRFLAERGLCADIYIPNRIDEGYGLNNDAIQKINEKKSTLIITVDCGITGIKETEFAKKLGIDIVITDHHEPGDSIPDAIAVVDAKRKDNKYPFRGLAGVGVTFKLIQAISKKLEIKEEEYLKYLDVVCVGTISDIVPLEDENRVISKLGIMLLKQTKNVGLKALIESVGYKKIDSSTISFGFAPRINACGRMGHEKDAINLFLTDDIEEARKLTEQLNNYNVQRQEIEKKIFNEAKEEISKEDSSDSCIVIGKENWHHGVIGIVASKITEMYFKPSILLCYDKDEAKGSGRSIVGFDLHEALENSSRYLEQYGGHSMAIGVTLKKKNIKEFKKAIEQYAKEKNISNIEPILKIDDKVSLKDINIKDIKDLELLEPFGEENKTPLFQINNLRIESMRAILEGKHLKILLKEDNKQIDAIGFNMGNLSSEYRVGDRVDLVGSLEINSYNSTEKIQINIKDIRHSI